MIPLNEQERVTNYLTECMRTACENILSCQSRFRVEGLLGITLLDHGQVFLVNIHDTIQLPHADDSIPSRVPPARIPSRVPPASIPSRVPPASIPSRVPHAKGSRHQALGKCKVDVPKTSHLENTQILEDIASSTTLMNVISPLMDIKVKEEPIDESHPELVSVLSGVDIHEDEEEDYSMAEEDDLALTATDKITADLKPLPPNTSCSKPWSLQFPNLAERICSKKPTQDVTSDAEAESHVKQEADADLNIVPVKKCKMGAAVPNAPLPSEVKDSMQVQIGDLSEVAQIMSVGVPVTHVEVMQVNNGGVTGRLDNPASRVSDRECVQVASKWFNAPQRIVPYDEINKMTRVLGDGFATCSKCSVNYLRDQVHVCTLPVVAGQSCYQCPVCAMLFSSRIYMQDHLGGKHGAPRYACKLCNQTFNWRTVLKRHMEKFHGSTNPDLDKTKTGSTMPVVTNSNGSAL